MFTYKLSRVLKTKSDWGRHVKVFSVHPGLVDTDLLNTIEIMRQYPALADRITLRVSALCQMNQLCKVVCGAGRQGWCRDHHLRSIVAPDKSSQWRISRGQSNCQLIALVLQRRLPEPFVDKDLWVAFQMDFQGPVVRRPLKGKLISALKVSFSL